MSIKQLNPVLIFNGTAAQAIELYQRALGARSERVVRYGDVDQAVHPSKPEDKDRILHSHWQIGAGAVAIMDAPRERPVPRESNLLVSLDFDDAADLTRRFEALSAGGKVLMPLHDAFWGARFGMLTDAFGVGWMLSCAVKQG